MTDYNYKYFSDYKENAEFKDSPCSVCGTGRPCLVGIYFETVDDYDAVCIDCLNTGRARVHIPSYLQKALETSIRVTYPSLSDECVHDRVQSTVEELSRTPPVPWIQYNAWVVCDGDFARYLGEWDQAKFNERSPDGNGLALLMSVLSDSQRSGVKNEQSLWESLGDWTAVYVFECTTSRRLIAVTQSY